MNTSQRISLFILAALLAILPVGWASETHAQSGQGTQGTAPGTGGMQQQQDPQGTTPGSGRMRQQERSPGMVPGTGSTQHQGGMAPSTGSMQQQQVQGTIRTVDPSGGTLTLEDGTQLTIPPSINVPQGMLREGAMVKASFEEKGGQKVVTELEVEDSRK